MASVNTVVIQIGDNDEHVIDTLNKYLKENEKLGNPFKPMNAGESAGTKGPTKTLIWGGINYLHTQEFVDLFLSLDTMNSLMTIFNSDGDFCYVVSKDVSIDVINKREEMY